MSELDDLDAVFDADTATKLQQQYGNLPEWARPAVATAALSPDMAAHRMWLMDEVRGLDSLSRREVISRLRTAEQYVQTVVELSVGAVLSSSGLSVSHNPQFGSLTPDLLLVDAEGKRAIVEVWTRSVPPGTSAILRRWGALARAVAKIPVPVQLSVDSSEHTADDPPSHKEIGFIAKSIKKWLLSTLRTTSALSVAGYTFAIHGQAPGLRAELIPPRPSTHADSRHVWDTVNDKVARYRKLATQENLPLMIVLSAEPGAGLDQSLVTSALSGRNTLTLNFTMQTFGAMTSRPTELRRTDGPPRFDACLSAVSWFEGPLGQTPHLTCWRVPGAERRLKDIEGPQVTVESWPQ